MIIIAQGVERCIAGEEAKPIVFLNERGNGLGRMPSEELLKHSKGVFRKVRNRGGIPVIVGGIPPRKKNQRWVAFQGNCKERLAGGLLRMQWIAIR